MGAITLTFSGHSRWGVAIDLLEWPQNRLVVLPPCHHLADGRVMPLAALLGGNTVSGELGRDRSVALTQSPGPENPPHNHQLSGYRHHGLAGAIGLKPVGRVTGGLALLAFVGQGRAGALPINSRSICARPPKSVSTNEPGGVEVSSDSETLCRSI